MSRKRERLAFGAWLEQEMSYWNVSQAQLAAAGGFTSGQVSCWVRGVRLPSPASCARIATAMRLSSEEVLAAAGYVALSGDHSPLVRRIVGLLGTTRIDRDRAFAIEAMLRTWSRLDAEAAA